MPRPAHLFLGFVLGPVRLARLSRFPFSDLLFVSVLRAVGASPAPGPACPRPRRGRGSTPGEGPGGAGRGAPGLLGGRLGREAEAVPGPTLLERERSRGLSQGRGSCGSRAGWAPWRQRRRPEQRGQWRVAAAFDRASSSPWGTCCPRTWTTPGASTSQVSLAPLSARRGPSWELPGYATIPARCSRCGRGPGRARPRARREWLGTKSIVPACFLHVWAPLPNLF